MSKQSSADVPVVNIANALTVVRLILVPVFIVMVLHGNDMGMLLATLVFTVAALTDKLDGYLARRLNLITNFGKLADPIADKALTMSALVLLSYLGQLWWWVTIVIIVRELGITFMRMAMVRKGAVMAASKGGKLKNHTANGGHCWFADALADVPARCYCQWPDCYRALHHDGGFTGYRGDRRRLCAAGNYP